MTARLTQEEFIQKAREKHGERFDYTQTRYVNARTPITIICVEHQQAFEIYPAKHLKRDGGCPICDGRGQTMTGETFAQKAAMVHGGKYQYDQAQAEFVNRSTPVTIVCPVHGKFKQKPFHHLKGSGCQKCAAEKKRIIGRTKGGTAKPHQQYDYWERARKVHGGVYDYLQQPQQPGDDDDVHATCSIHGPFVVKASLHLLGVGCPECAKARYK